MLKSRMHSSGLHLNFVVDKACLILKKKKKIPNDRFPLRQNRESVKRCFTRFHVGRRCSQFSLCKFCAVYHFHTVRKQKNKWGALCPGPRKTREKKKKKICIRGLHPNKETEIRNSQKRFGATESKCDVHDGTY